MPIPRVMLRDPILVPPRPGIFAVYSSLSDQTLPVAFQARDVTLRAFVGFATNMQSTSYQFASELARCSCKRLRVLPTDDPQPEFTFHVVREIDTEDKQLIDAGVIEARESFHNLGYELLGPRGRDQFRLRLNGQVMTIAGALAYAAAIDPSRPLPSYNTVWQRLERGVTSEQAVGLEPMPPRWGKKLAQQRDAEGVIAMRSKQNDAAPGGRSAANTGVEGDGAQGDGGPGAHDAGEPPPGRVTGWQQPPAKLSDAGGVTAERSHQDREPGADLQRPGEAPQPGNAGPDP